MVSKSKYLFLNWKRQKPKKVKIKNQYLKPKWKPKKKCKPLYVNEIETGKFKNRYL